MAEQEKLVTGSPFVATGIAWENEASLSRIKLVATGGACKVRVSDAATEIITMDASVGNPDEYVGAANRKLKFGTNVSLEFTGGTGKIYLYYT